MNRLPSSILLPLTYVAECQDPWALSLRDRIIYCHRETHNDGALESLFRQAELSQIFFCTCLSTKFVTSGFFSLLVMVLGNFDMDS